MLPSQVSYTTSEKEKSLEGKAGQLIKNILRPRQRRRRRRRRSQCPGVEGESERKCLRERTAHTADGTRPRSVENSHRAREKTSGCHKGQSAGSNTKETRRASAYTRKMARHDRGRAAPSSGTTRTHYIVNQATSPECRRFDRSR